MIEILFTQRIKRITALVLAFIIIFGLATTGNGFVPAVAASTEIERISLSATSTDAVAFGNQNYRNLNLTPGGNVGDMHFTWHSQSPTGSVRIYPAGETTPIAIGASSNPRVLDARSTDTSWFPGVTPDYTVHFVVVTGLSPSTDYEYVVVGENFESLRKPFRTGGDDNFSFLIAGDPQLGIDRQPGPAAYSSWQNTMNVAMNRVPNAAFLLSVGDQIHSNNNTYANHFARAQYMHDALLSPPVFHSLPFVPVVGNHEAGSANANGPLWHLNYGTLNPIGSGTALGNVRRLENGPIHFDYYMRWGNVIIIQLDSNLHSLALSGSRYAWFTNVLAEHSDAEWRVVTFHHPPYSAYRPSTNTAKQNIIANWLPAFERHNIDIVLSGHCHSYSRSHHMQGNIPVLEQQWLDANGTVLLGADATNAVLDPTGITYIAFNSASGSGFYNVTAMAGRYYLAMYNQNFMRNFSVVDVTPNTFSVATYQINNDDSTTLVDVYTIVRSDNGAVPSGTITRQMGDTQWGTFVRATIEPITAPLGSSLTTIEGLLPTQVLIETDLRNNDVGTPEALRPSESGIPDYGPIVRPLSVNVIWDMGSIIPAFVPDLTTYQTYTIRGSIPGVAGGIVYIEVTVGDPPPPPFDGYISYFGARYRFYGRSNSAFLTDAFNPAIFSNWVGGGAHPQGAPTPIGFGTPMSLANAGAANFSGTLATTIPAGPASYQRGAAHPFTYFSRTFNLPDDFCVENMGDVYGAHHIDDNLILFINGVEVYRYNTSTTPANVSIGQAINWSAYVGQNTDARLRSFNINSNFNSRNTGYYGVHTHTHVFMHDAASRTNLEAALVPGQNVLTAVVGNNSAGSSDLWFDLELFVDVGLPCECTEYSALDLAIAAAQSQNATVYTSASWQTMQDALTTAIAVRNNELATQQEIDTATTALNAAIAGLVSDGYISYFGARYRFYGRSNSAFLTDAFNPAIFSNWVGGGAHPQGAPTPIGFGTPMSVANAGAGNHSGSLATLIPDGAAPYQRGENDSGGIRNHTFTYFSRTFNLPDDFCVDSIGNVYGAHHIDDSLILFINGIEVYRFNTRERHDDYVDIGHPINWAVFLNRNTDARLRHFHINEDLNRVDSGYPSLIAGFNLLHAMSRTNLEAALMPGQNVMTAVVGNNSSSSSDLWFDLELFIEMNPCECDTVDKIALIAAIANAGARVEANYTPASWQAMQDALTDANTVNNNATATQTEVDAATAALNDAIAGLMERANKTALALAMANAGTRVESNYTPASWQTMQDAFTAANAVNNNAAATQTEVDAATVALDAAIAGLVERANKTALALAIANAGARIEANYTPASWQAMQDAFTTANAVNNNATASQAEVDAAASALDAAIAGLETVTIVDRAALALAIANAGVRVEANYTSASWQTMQDAFAAANTVNNNTDASQTEIDAAAAALNIAIAGLVEQANKTALALAIANAGARTEANYTSASWLAMQNALTAANAVNNNATATQTEVDAATAALNTAIAGLETVTIVDKTALALAIANAGTRTEANYTPASWLAMQDALTAANTANNNATATQAEVDAATAALNTAIAGLVTVTIVDRTALALAITNAGTRVQTNYTSASWATMQNALTAANTVNNNAAATQAEVNAATAALNAAITGLANRPQTSEPSQPTQPSQPSQPSSPQPAQPLPPPETYEPDDIPYEPTPQPTPIPHPTFVDVSYSDWFYEAVMTVVTAGVFIGTGNNEFSPNSHITRAEFVKAIANFTGVNLSAFAGMQSIFDDVAADMWYSDAIEWATAYNIVTGFGDGTFRPYAPITREQMALVVFRFLQSTNFELPVMSTHAFVDQGSISYWALEAVLAMQATGIMIGNANGEFSPHDATTRAEVAALFARLLNLT